MPPVRRGLNDRVQLKALEVANQRASQQLRVAPSQAQATRPEATDSKATEPEPTEPEPTEPGPLEAAEPEAPEVAASRQASLAASDPLEKARWAALVATTLAISAEAVWEIMEYGAMRMGAHGMDLSYSDTMEDIIDSTLGAIVGGLFTLMRVPRSREDRKRVGWRSPLGA